MPYLFIRHKVQDYPKWRAAFDAHDPARLKAGLRAEGVFQEADDPNDLVLVFMVTDEQKARQFLRSDDLRQAMQRAGVTQGPWVHFMSQRETARV